MSTYVRVDTKFTTHPKVLDIGPLGEALWLRGLCYSGDQLTDGFVPLTFLKRMGDMKACVIAARLVSAGLWDEVDGGYRIHDYTDWQRSRDEVAEISSKRADAGRVGGKQRASNLLANSQANAKQTGSKTQADTDTDTDTDKTTPPSPPKPSNGRADAAAADSYYSIIGESTCSKVAEQFRRIDASLVPGWFGGMLRTAQSQCGPAHRPQLEEAVKVTLSEVERRLAAEKNGGGGVPVVSVKKFTEAVFLRNLTDALGVAK